MSAALKPEGQPIRARLRIAQAEIAEELEAIYRFRYRIYVDEMGRVQHDADHEARRIRDALDDGAINLAAWQSDEVVGAFRVNLSVRGSLGYYEAFYEMGQSGDDHPLRTCIVTRAMVAKRLRCSDVAVRLCVAAFDVAVRHGVRWSFMDCNDHLVRFFTALGFVEYTSPKVHKEYGEVHLMRLDLEDHEHLRRLKSPFCRVFDGAANSEHPRRRNP
ncbi:GNAT family N-acyltransferase [Nevskia sp.]|uniref:GNAT family N-acyltransferase n=1 Tax=Nevskia sp. TaxID=1929292 RepID=UPI0025D2F611|nr:GNAT family N-acyltransferase [Nevskia sp.]